MEKENKIEDKAILISVFLFVAFLFLGYLIYQDFDSIFGKMEAHRPYGPTYNGRHCFRSEESTCGLNLYGCENGSEYKCMRDVEVKHEK